MIFINNLINVEIKNIAFNLHYYRNIKKFEEFYNEASDEVDNKKYITIDSYRKFWANYILKEGAANKEEIPDLSNKWAFATFAGSLLYEKEINKNNNYFKDDDLIRSIGSLLSEQKVSIQNFMIYGFGGLARESLYIKEYLSKQQDKKLPLSILLFDCSPYYFSLAKQWDTKIKTTLKDEKINQLDTYLIDFEKYANDIKSIRSDKKMNGTTLHIFLGNIGGNLTAEQFRDILDSTTTKDDYVLLEYAHYPESFFQNIEINNDDYVVKIAKGSLEELFGDIKSEIIYKTGNNEKYLEISGTALNETFKFKSMLRRNFDIKDVTTNNFGRVGKNIFEIFDKKINITRKAALFQKLK